MIGLQIFLNILSRQGPGGQSGFICRTAMPKMPVGIHDYSQYTDVSNTSS